MRHVDRGDAKFTLEALQEGPRLQAQASIEVGERLVEQEDRRVDGHGTGQGDALLLPTRKLRGPSREGVLQLELRGDRLRSGFALGSRDLADLERVGDVVEHAHMRIQGVVLEDHGHVARAGRQVGHVTTSDGDASGRGPFEPGDGAQQRRLATARRSEQGEELAVFDAQIEPVEGANTATEVLDQRADLDLTHQRLIPP